VNRRRVLAVLAATVAAPYLPFLLAGLAWDLFVTPVASPVEYLGVLFVGTIGLLIYGIPLFLLAYILAALCHHLGQETLLAAMAGGLLLGSGFGAVLIGFDSNLKSTLLLLSFPLSGALCGWIYWLIARERTSPPPDAIEAG
jgi:hypothetical protein